MFLYFLIWQNIYSCIWAHQPPLHLSWHILTTALKTKSRSSSCEFSAFFLPARMIYMFRSMARALAQPYSERFIILKIFTFVFSNDSLCFHSNTGTTVGAGLHYAWWKYMSHSISLHWAFKPIFFQPTVSYGFIHWKLFALALKLPLLFSFLYQLSGKWIKLSLFWHS